MTTINEKKMPALALSLIIPAYNEQSGIKHTLERIKQIPQSVNWEIIVVDDGSTDDTASIAEHEGVTVIKHRQNRGYGRALKTGIKHSSQNILCITDADGTYPNESIPDLANVMVTHDCDMVVGARTGASVVTAKTRSVAKWALNRLANWVVEERIPDLNSGLRLFKKEAVSSFLRILPNGFSFTTTITLAMLVNDYSVRYYSIDYFQRKGRSKIRPIRDTINFINLILRIGLYFAPLKIFLPLSGMVISAGVAWGLFSTFVLDRFADASTLTLVMAGLQIGVIGLLAELINQRTHNSHWKS